MQAMFFFMKNKRETVYLIIGCVFLSYNRTHRVKAQEADRSLQTQERSCIILTSSCRMEAESMEHEHASLLVNGILTRHRIACIPVAQCQGRSQRGSNQGCVITSLFCIGSASSSPRPCEEELPSPVSSSGFLSPGSVAERGACARTMPPLHQSCGDARANPIPRVLSHPILFATII